MRRHVWTRALSWAVLAALMVGAALPAAPIDRAIRLLDRVRPVR